MKTSLKTLSFIFFIPLMLLIFPLHSRAEEKSSTQTKDIQKSTNDEVEKYIENGVFKIHFNKNDDKEKRTIESALIIEAIKNGVNKIDIKNAIITGDLDFHIEKNLVDIDKAGIEADEIKRLKRRIEKVYLVSSSIRIYKCQLQGNLIAGYHYYLESMIIFDKPVSF